MFQRKPATKNQPFLLLVDNTQGDDNKSKRPQEPKHVIRFIDIHSIPCLKILGKETTASKHFLIYEKSR